ncbi:hypothetical protein [Bacillus wiedmannii]|uniref:hypothetical protein n=1 Tax=Bacillus wiedmannii TaxID=1890302 RepID=UPI0015CF3CBF|nr:hypothetical protein [Bacillus wiedmannii]
MTTERLEEELNKTLDNFRENTLFNLETFEQVHEKEYLTKEDFLKRTYIYMSWITIHHV